MHDPLTSKENIEVEVFAVFLLGFGGTVAEGSGHSCTLLIHINTLILFLITQKKLKFLRLRSFSGISGSRTAVQTSGVL